MSQSDTPREKAEILADVRRLLYLYESGALGGKIMPENANPGLEINSRENFLYFTLPMALNYQRNSYKLWEAAKLSYADPDTSDIFTPAHVMQMSADELRQKMLKYKVALQPNRHPAIWKTLCETLYREFHGDVRALLSLCNHSVTDISGYMQANKKRFPYLSGTKIMNYWLYVLEKYTAAEFLDRQNITVAPDTHVIKSSVKLGLINDDVVNLPNTREKVSGLWAEILRGTELVPIDIHTPLWLWSRSGFAHELKGEEVYLS
jgi:hypothetical protein